MSRRARLALAPLAIGCILASVFPLPAGIAAQTPIIDVEKEADRRIAIGIGKYAQPSTADVGSPAGDVVAFDLELSGWFDARRPGLLPPRSLADWERLGAELVVELDEEGGALHGRIRDVGTGGLLLDRTYPQTLGGIRSRLHRFSDDVVVRLTGQPGLSRTKILCEWDPGDGKRLVSMDIDGHDARELTGEAVLELAPRYAADGKSAVYTSYSSGFPDVYIHDLVVGSRKRVAHYEGLNAHGDLDADGERLALTLSAAGNPEIYSKNLGSGRITRLTNHRATDASPVWSPDGNRIAFVSDRSGTPQIYLMNADGGNVERLTFRGSYNTSPDWAPDGKRIAYCALQPNGYQIQVIELATNTVTTVTELGGCEDPSWSPDGRSILYSRRAGGRTDLFVTQLNELRALRVSRGSGRFSSPDWSPVPELDR